jgi:hypothetical protein
LRRAANPKAPKGALVVSASGMKICYVDEAGCTGMLPSANTNIQPAMVFSAVAFDYSRLHRITESYLSLKQRFFPALFPRDVKRFLSGILNEIKGADLRKQIVEGGRNQRRHAFGFLDGVIRILEDNDVQIFGRIWVNGIAKPIDGRALYTYSIQSMCSIFQNFLDETRDFGMVILDSRWQSVNTQVAHSIFTQKFRFSGDSLDRILDLPGFAHSNNHAGLQLADLIASAIVFPMTTLTYCTGHVTGIHVQCRYSLIKDRYKIGLSARQYRYKEANGRMRGGLIVSDDLAHRHGGLLFV